MYSDAPRSQQRWKQIGSVEHPSHLMDHYTTDGLAGVCCGMQTSEFALQSQKKKKLVRYLTTKANV